MSSESLFDAAIQLTDKEITVRLLNGPDGYFIKMSEKGNFSKRIILSIPLAGLDDLKKAITEAQKVAKGIIGKDRAAAVANAPGAGEKTRKPREKKERTPREPREPRPAVNHSEPEVVSRSVYVSGLSWDTTADTVKNHFKRMGNILNTTILMHRRGRALVSRGCAVIEFKTSAEAQRAIREMGQSELEARTIKCREDRGDIAKDGGVAGLAADGNADAAAATSEDKPKRARRERKPREKKAASTEDKKLEPTMVFVSNLSWETTSDVLSNFLSSVGDVKSCEVLTAKSGRSLGHAVVAFGRASQAKEAIERFNGKELEGRTIGVKEYFTFVDK